MCLGGIFIVSSAIKSPTLNNLIFSCQYSLYFVLYITVPFDRMYKIFCKDTGCLMIYWLRFTRAFRLEAGIGTELSTENPECFQERTFNARRRSAEWQLSSPLSTNSFITRLLNTLVKIEVSCKGIWWIEPVSSIPTSKTIQW